MTIKASGWRVEGPLGSGQGCAFRHDLTAPYSALDGEGQRQLSLTPVPALCFPAGLRGKWSFSCLGRGFGNQK